MRLVPRAVAAVAAAIPLTLLTPATSRGEDPAPAAPRSARPAAAPARAKPTAGRGSGATDAPASASRAPQTASPGDVKRPEAEPLPWSSPPGGFDGDEQVEVVRTGRCGG